ncbi:hypothetical protein, partial [Novosphingobium indicum]|uniref:hypothetical protein n=1 Tax=Novosphingobium indicum TaxID=462949 RepID=UPI001E3A3720
MDPIKQGGLQLIASEQHARISNTFWAGLALSVVDRSKHIDKLRAQSGQPYRQDEIAPVGEFEHCPQLDFVRLCREAECLRHTYDGSC